VPSTIDILQLGAIPYLDLENLGGRSIASLMFCDEGRWRMWVELEGEGPGGARLAEIQAFPAEMFFFARGEAVDDDIVFHFLEFIAQRACFPPVAKPFMGIQDDVFTLSASLAKMEVLHAKRAEVGHGVHRMAASEVELIFTVCRSVFDLLQEIAAKLWDTVKLRDEEIKKRQLRESFNDMLYFKGEPETREGLMSRFGLPEPWAEFYVAWRPFLQRLRGFRDEVVHRGASVQTIFVADDGFRIAGHLRSFHGVDMWRAGERDQAGHVPLIPALNFIVFKTLGACEDFGRMVSQIVEFPPPVAPGFNFAMRGYFNAALARAIRDAVQRIAPSATNAQAGQ